MRPPVPKSNRLHQDQQHDFSSDVPMSSKRKAELQRQCRGAPIQARSRPRLQPPSQSLLADTEWNSLESDVPNNVTGYQLEPDGSPSGVASADNDGYHQWWDIKEMETALKASGSLRQ